MRTRAEQAAYIEGFKNGGRRMIGNVRIAYGLMPEEGTPEMKQAVTEFDSTVENIIMINWTDAELKDELDQQRFPLYMRGLSDGATD